MKGYINGFDWVNASPMLYWSYPASYKKNAKEEIKNYIFSGQYYGALKVDGYYQRLIKDEDGNCFMIARSKNVKGEAVNKIDWVPQLKEFMKHLPNGTVLLSECYLPGNEGSKNITTLLGCLQDKCIARQETGQKLHFYVFDVCAYAMESYVSTPIKDRIKVLEELSAQYVETSQYVRWAKYFTGKKLWEALQIYLQSGREGIVITREDCPIFFKRTPARMTIKVKKEIQETIDCFFTGRATAPTRLYTGKEIETWKYWENDVTGEKLEGEYYFKKGNAPLSAITKPYFYGWAGSLEIGVMKDGKIEPIGFLSGLADEIKANFKDYAMTPIEVTAMEVLETGGLRHAKMVRFRPDLSVDDCNWNKIFK